jgi:hypothetical protein
LQLALESQRVSNPCQGAIRLPRILHAPRTLAPRNLGHVFAVNRRHEGAWRGPAVGISLAIRINSASGKCEVYSTARDYSAWPRLRPKTLRTFAILV